MLAQKASKSLLCSVIPFICGWKVRNLQEALCSSINEEDEEETKVLSSICVNQQQICFLSSSSCFLFLGGKGTEVGMER